MKQKNFICRKGRGAFILVMSVASGFVSSVLHAQELKARGVIRPNAEAAISSELVARIVDMPVAEGERFKKGDLLVEFDCSRYQAQYEATVADTRAEKALLKQAKILRKHKAGGKTAVTVGIAKVNRAEAEQAALKVTLRQCVITAPFDGRVVEWLANEYERPPANKPILTIVDDSKLQVESLIPSKWLQQIETGRQFQFHVDETGKSYDMEIKQIGAVVDPVSQRIKIKATFSRDTSGILPGMSGTARFASGDG